MITLPVVIEGIVALLLAATLVFCILLERRLRSFRAGEAVMRELVAELATSTERAERAVLGLGETTRETQAALDHRIAEARSLTNQLALISRDGDRRIGRASLSRKPAS